MVNEKRIIFEELPYPQKIFDSPGNDDTEVGGYPELLAPFTKVGDSNVFGEEDSALSEPSPLTLWYRTFNSLRRADAADLQQEKDQIPFRKRLAIFWGALAGAGIVASALLIKVTAGIALVAVPVVAGFVKFYTLLEEPEKKTQEQLVKEQARAQALALDPGLRVHDAMKQGAKFPNKDKSSNWLKKFYNRNASRTINVFSPSVDSPHGYFTSTRQAEGVIEQKVAAYIKKNVVHIHPENPAHIQAIRYLAESYRDAMYLDSKDKGHNGKLHEHGERFKMVEANTQKMDFGTLCNEATQHNESLSAPIEQRPLPSQLIAQAAALRVDAAKAKDVTIKPLEKAKLEKQKQRFITHK